MLGNKVTNVSSFAPVILLYTCFFEYLFVQSDSVSPILQTSIGWHDDNFAEVMQFYFPWHSSFLKDVGHLRSLQPTWLVLLPPAYRQKCWKSMEAQRYWWRGGAVGRIACCHLSHFWLCYLTSTMFDLNLLILLRHFARRIGNKIRFNQVSKTRFFRIPPQTKISLRVQRLAYCLTREACVTFVQRCLSLRLIRIPMSHGCLMRTSLRRVQMSKRSGRNKKPLKWAIGKALALSGFVANS